METTNQQQQPNFFTLYCLQRIQTEKKTTEPYETEQKTQTNEYV